MLALELEPLIREKARENIREGGFAGGKGLQNSVKASEKINTQKEVAKIAGISHATVYMTRTRTRIVLNRRQ